MKALGIGLGRTGTMSLARALEQLGYRTTHFPRCYLDRDKGWENLCPFLRKAIPGRPFPRTNAVP